MITIDRAALLKACETVKPALATKDFIEELLHLWFDGETVTAYNDAAFGIQAPLKSDLHGGFRGSILLGLLTNSVAKKVEIEFEQDGDNNTALIRAGRTKLKMSVFAVERAVHVLPEEVRKPVALPLEFYEALKAVVISVAPTSAVPDQAGVSLEYQKGVLSIYTSDAKTISWARVPEVKSWPPGRRILLPLQFVEELIKVGDAGTELHVSEDEVMAVTKDGVRLFMKLAYSPHPLDFEMHVTASLKNINFLTIPTKLRLMLERSTVMLDGQQEQAINVSVDDDLLHFHADTFFGELKDSLRLEEVLPEAVQLRVNPDLIKRAFPFCDRIAFASDRVAMQGNNFVHLIGSYSTED